MFFRLGRIATRYRWLIVGLWMVFIAIALPFAPRATQVLHAGGFVSPDFESERAITLLAQKLHFDPTIVQVIFTSQGFNADSLAFPQEAQQALTRVRGWSEVSGVISFTDNPRQISIDRHAAYVNVLLKPDPDTAPKLLPELERRLQAVPDLQTHIGGGPVFFADIQLVSERDLRRAEILALPFALVALLLVFRSVVAAILPALVGGSAVIVALALIFGLGHLTTLSIFVLNITTLFGLGLGVDDSLFMVSRFREELARGRTVDDAVTITVATAGRAVTFSGLIVSIGLTGLTFFRINMIHSVGYGGILVVVLAVLAAITLLPAALSILASYGALVVIFQNGFLHQVLGFTPLGFVEASSPILLFCALFGLSMDYEVFLLSRIQEAYWQSGDNAKAGALGLQRSGRIITSAALIVIVVSGCFATADMILVKALGLGMALAVALDATLVRGLLVPATMRLLGDWNWWLPFAGVQPRQPVLAESLAIEEPKESKKDELYRASGENAK